MDENYTRIINLSTEIFMRHFTNFTHTMGMSGLEIIAITIPTVRNHLEKA
jgi:hypothetical protein